jgi:hypothetical protein
MSKALSKSVARGALLAAVAGSLAVAVAQVGCSDAGGRNQPTETTGSASLEFTLPGGAQVNTLNWNVTGPGSSAADAGSGTVNVQDSGVSDGGVVTVSFHVLVSGASPTANYTATASAVSTDGTVSCYGSTTFVVSSSTGVTVNVPIRCGPASEAGAATFNGAVYSCAAISSISAEPLETTVGNSVALSATATGPIADGGSLTYTWTATSGSFDTPNTASANFTCSVAGPASVTLTVADGPVADGGLCNSALSTQSIQIQCDP